MVVVVGWREDMSSNEKAADKKDTNEKAAIGKMPLPCLPTSIQLKKVTLRLTAHVFYCTETEGLVGEEMIPSKLQTALSGIWCSSREMRCFSLRDTWQDLTAPLDT